MADPSSGKLTTSGAQNAIVVVGQLDDGRAFVVDEWAERCSSDVLTEKIFMYNRRWKTKRFGIDSTGQQNLYFQAVNKEANLRRERICLVPVEFKSNEQKEFRITVNVQRWMHNGLLFVSEHCKKLLRQLEVYPTGTLCDLADALAAALGLLRDPLASRAKLAYDPDYDENARFLKNVRKDERYIPFRR